MSTTLSPLPSTYGPKVTNRDYELLVANSDFFQPVLVIDGHSLGSPDVDQTDPVSVSRMYRERGRLIRRSEYVKPSLIQSRTYEIGLPDGAMWSPLAKITQTNGGACRRYAFARYLCPETPCYSHAFVYPDAMFDPIVETNALIATTDDEEALTATTNLRTTRREVLYNLQVVESFQDTTPAIDINKVLYNYGGCENCGADSVPYHYGGWIVGDDSAVTPAPLVQKTTDRFATFTTVAAPAGTGATTVANGYAEGDFAIFVANDGTDSEIWVTFNSTSIQIASAAYTAAVLNTVAKGGSYYWVGGTAGTIARSQDGLNWTDLTLPASLATAVIHAFAWDESTQSMYAVGNLGAASLVLRIQGNIVSNITTSVAAGNNVLYSAFVLDKDHVIVAGAAGTVRESTNASTDSAWTTVSIGVADRINAIGGTKYRVLAATETSGGGGGNIYERSILTDMRFAAMSQMGGFTIDGDILGGAFGDPTYGLNDAVFVAINEVFVVKSCLPDA